MSAWAYRTNAFGTTPPPLLIRKSPLFEESVLCVGERNVNTFAYQERRGQCDKSEFAEGVVFRVRFGASNYEGGCRSRELMAHYSEEIVFFKAWLHR
jgi:hypothetical protein